MRVNTAARRIDSPGNTELPTSHNPEPRTSDPTARKLLLDREIGPHIEGPIGPLHLARVSAASAWESTFRWSATFLRVWQISLARLLRISQDGQGYFPGGPCHGGRTEVIT
jgi:hypothetical protein